MEDKQIDLLKSYCEKDQNILLAFVYGSQARKSETGESDVDIAVWLKDNRLENSIWRDLTSLVQAEVDLVMLDQASATLIANILKSGMSLTIKDRKLYWKLYLEKTSEAEDFTAFAQNYWQIYQRARSLTPEDKFRVLERIVFLESELAETSKFQKIDRHDYESNKSARREMERWAENVINAQIDIAKIVLASEHKEMPKTYEEVLSRFASLAGLSQDEATMFSNFARLRNILAHEYLDVIYEKIANLIDKFPPLYAKISVFLREYLK